MAKLKRSALLAIQRLRRGKSPMKKQPIFFPQNNKFIAFRTKS